MDLRRLQHFLVLAEHLSFTRAAEAVGIAQPTLSHQILALEKDLGTKLFDRTGRTLRLTDAGTAYLAEVQVALAQLELAANRAREAEQGQRGVLVVGAASPPTMTYLPAVARAFRRRYPAATLQLRIMHSTGLVEALRKRRIQLGFAGASLQAEGLAKERLWEMPMRVALPAEHPAARNASVSLRQLGTIALVMYARSLIAESFDQVLAFCEKQGFVPATVVEATSIESVIGLVACGSAVSILPVSWESLRLPDVAFRKISGSRALTFRIAAFRHEDDVSALVSGFLNLARDVEA